MRLITVGDASRQLGVSTEAVRYYERKGLIAPVRDSSGRRLLSPEDIERIREFRERRRQER